MAEQRVADEALIKRYLLGELAEAEQLQLEERLLTDEEYFAQLQSVEEDLIDSYARGALPPSEVEKFESYFMAAPERQRAVHFAMALQGSTPPSGAPLTPPAWWRSVPVLAQLRHPAFAGIAALGVVLFLVVGVGVWSNKSITRQRSAEEQLRAEQTKRQEPGAARPVVAPPSDEGVRPREEAAQHLRPEVNQRDQLDRYRPDSDAPQSTSSQGARGRQAGPSRMPPDVVVLALMSGRMRSAGGTKTATLTANQQLRLELILEDDGYARYRAEIRTPEGRSVARRENLRAQQTKAGKILVVTLPATLVAAGDYGVTLSGVPAGGGDEQLDPYYFRVVTK